jgi:hypothetical protein
MGWGSRLGKRNRIVHFSSGVPGVRDGAPGGGGVLSFMRASRKADLRA